MWNLWVSGRSDSELNSFLHRLLGVLRPSAVDGHRGSLFGKKWYLNGNGSREKNTPEKRKPPLLYEET